MRFIATDRDHAAQITDVTLRNGGATFLLADNSFLSAPTAPTYIVGGVVASRIVPVAGFGARDVTRLLEIARAVGASGVGTWVHNGEVHVDVVNVLADEREAVALAESRGEVAIYEVLNGREIYTAREPIAA